jgi:ribonuclease HI
MYFDGSYTLNGAGAGVVLISPEGDVLKYAIQVEFPATNNIVEYEGWSMAFGYLWTSEYDDSSSGEIHS